MGGFRTPARTKTRDPRWPASGNLHHAGHPGAFSSSSEADIAVVDVVDREGGNLPFIRPALNGEVVPTRDLRSVMRLPVIGLGFLNDRFVPRAVTR